MSASRKRCFVHHVMALLRVTDLSAGLTETEERTTAAFVKYFPGMSDSIALYHKRPGCSCRHDISRAITQNPDLTQRFLDDAFAGEYEFMGIPLPPDHTIAKPSVAGRVMVIEDTEEAYTKLIADTAQTASYSGLSVVPSGDGQLRVFFY